MARSVVPKLFEQEVPCRHLYNNGNVPARAYGKDGGGYLHAQQLRPLFPRAYALGEDGRPQVVFGRQGKRDYKNAFLRQEREDGRIFYTVAGEIFDTDKSEPTDIYAVEQGYIAVTPLMVDLTDYIAIEKLLNR